MMKGKFVLVHLREDRANVEVNLTWIRYLKTLID